MPQQKVGGSQMKSPTTERGTMASRKCRGLGAERGKVGGKVAGVPGGAARGGAGPGQPLTLLLSGHR